MIRRYQSIRVNILPIAAAFALLTTSATSARAGEICIRCTAPEQTYRCAVVGNEVPADLRRRGFYCASRIAKDEGHDTCAAVRKETQCQGVQRSYVYDPHAAVPGPLADESQAGTEDEAERTEDDDGPPKTVVDLTRETARQTEESLEEAADQTVETTRGVGERVRDAAGTAATAVEEATRTTIRCIGSLFDDC
ncbi:hypothetical protein [Dichotomicrobium thermohalophilum]|uniref:Uncharacterized protein n=1 Tax=Dichotomicrobium thermohalophilum TaxID=933063 RepID=A0A397Q7B1_9HYPH|nr:hypothetical protein [Dichotomicrobium thermohalophilum]RIA56369.1 hypothetical protein BXY53_1474 [Dichotomicrobium thermohalophilum]